MSENTKCPCGLLSKFQCSACGDARYCSKECQKSFWTVHKITSCNIKQLNFLPQGVIKRAEMDSIFTATESNAGRKGIPSDAEKQTNWEETILHCKTLSPSDLNMYIVRSRDSLSQYNKSLIPRALKWQYWIGRDIISANERGLPEEETIGFFHLLADNYAIIESTLLITRVHLESVRHSFIQLHEFTQESKSKVGKPTYFFFTEVIKELGQRVRQSRNGAASTLGLVSMAQVSIAMRASRELKNLGDNYKQIITEYFNI